MIPADESSGSSTGEERKIQSGRGGDGGKDGGHIFIRQTKVSTRSMAKRCRLSAGFKGIKRRRRSLMFKRSGRRSVFGRMGVNERFRILLKDTTTFDLEEVKRSRQSKGSSTSHPDCDDAVVPRSRCDESDRGSEEDAVILTRVAAAPRDVIQRCYRLTSPHPHQYQQHRLQQQPVSSDDRVPSLDLINIPVPEDPRQWSRLDVRTWLEHVRHIYEIRDLDLDRFPVNGKALCIMTMDMFLYRVPQGGIPLYLDFQTRFRRALGSR